MIHEKYALPVLPNTIESDEPLERVQLVIENNSEFNPAGADLAQPVIWKQQHLANRALDHFLTSKQRQCA
jgi:hypothetical protein